MNCQICQSEMPEHLFGSSRLPPAIQAHLDTCEGCTAEYNSFQATFRLLDTWEAPEPSPYFDQKLAVRIREERALPSASWFERLQSRLLFNTGRQFRPALVGVMALLLILGGGTFAGIENFSAHPSIAPVSATVGDLEILDKNDQAFEQMDQLLQDEDSGDDSSSTPPRS